MPSLSDQSEGWWFGLNLTAAEYVYLLDPWWNPAVEAQAIDRSHRIGQTQHVFAYRLICRGTVEEKILELQQKKRDLADAILNADNRGVVQNLSREDLEFFCHEDLDRDAAFSPHVRPLRYTGCTSAFARVRRMKSSMPQNKRRMVISNSR